MPSSGFRALWDSSGSRCVDPYRLVVFLSLSVLWFRFLIPLLDFTGYLQFVSTTFNLHLLFFAARLIGLFESLESACSASDKAALRLCTLKCATRVRIRGTLQDVFYMLEWSKA